MSIAVAVIGGGMITHDQILPSLYQLQRLGMVGDISVCARHATTVEKLAQSELIARAFPGHSFRAYPTKIDAPQPELYRQVLESMPAGNIAIVAVPDQLHYDVILAALRAGQHVCAVKPLVLEVAQSIEIEREARERGLVVGIEYHKRFDDRSLMARGGYREGKFGEFRLGTACLLEKWYYRHSNFQNWFTKENSDAFAYIGCHYVDLVQFITGLHPVAVSVYGLLDRFPNGNEGYLWADARILWNNGACLNVQCALGFPDAAPGSNTQGLTMYCSGGGGGALISHSDQFRGLKYSYADQTYSEPSPDYLQYIDLGGPGLVPVGYGYRSIEHIVRQCIRVAGALPENRAALLSEIDATGIMATPANSRHNERVLEAGRQSILDGGRLVTISNGL